MLWILQNNLILILTMAQNPREGVIVLDQIGNLLNSVVSLFCCVGITGIYGTDITPAYALFCLSYAALLVLSLTRIYYIQMSGERLCSVYSDIRQGYIVDCHGTQAKYTVWCPLVRDVLF